MPVSRLADGRKAWQRRERKQQLARWAMWLVGTAIFVWCWQRISGATTWFFVLDAPHIAGDILERAMPPRWSYISKLWWPIWDTLNIATLGTLMALVLAVPVAFMAARNTTPSRYFIRPLALLIIVSTRSINSLIWALLLIAIIGPGVFAGIVAIAIRSIGFCAKLLYEAIEEIDHSQVEAVTATGANRWQVMAYGIVPQVMPNFTSYFLLRLEINVRASTIIGAVGGGGIGEALRLSISRGHEAKTIAIIFLLFLTIVAVDQLSAWLRRRLVGEQAFAFGR